MKPFVLTLIISIFFIHGSFSQVENVQFELEKTPFKMSLNSGVYKSRLSGASTKENSFRNFSIFVQVYFPFKRSLDSQENFSQPTTANLLMLDHQNKMTIEYGSQEKDAC